MNRRTDIAAAALVFWLAACGLTQPHLDFTDPQVIVYTTRLGLAQTTDVVTAGLEHGQITVEQAKSYRTQLDRATAALNLAEGAIRAGKDASDYLETALNILSAVRRDPALMPLLGAPTMTT